MTPGRLVPGILIPWYQPRASSGSIRTPAMCTSGISRLLLNAHSRSAPRTCNVSLPSAIPKSTIPPPSSEPTFDNGHPSQAVGEPELSNSDLTSILFILLLLVGLAQLLGHLCVRLRQPKVVGEILAGVVLGPSLLGRFTFGSGFSQAAAHQSGILNFVYWLGLLLLMFLSGAETRQLFTREERREVGWLTIVGTGIPFVLGLLLGPWLVRPSLAGPNGNRVSLVIILAVGVAVTSVPVVSKIFADLKILHTRFARLVLGVAVLEDIVLWLALAIATAMAGKAVVNPRQMS